MAVSCSHRFRPHAPYIAFDNRFTKGNYMTRLASQNDRSVQRPDLAIVYEHPEWFKPLFAALDRRSVNYVAVPLGHHHFDLANRHAPAPLVLSRLAMSSFVRQSEHPIFYAQSLYAHWELAGARVINGTSALAVDASKVRQLSIIRSLGLATPETRVVHRRSDLTDAAAGMQFPIVVKVNIGGSGAGVSLYENIEQLNQAIENETTPSSIDGVLLVQDYVPARDRQIVRMETLAGKFLYAISLNTDSGTFDLCPADVCLADKPTITVKQFHPDAATIAAAEAIAQAANLDIGGIEFMVDDRDGVQRFYDINGLSNFVANPMQVLGWDPHENFVDYLSDMIEKNKEHAQ
jgi:glutathione synthase/RimK-type ligase-like ATP-grasp enzyme